MELSDQPIRTYVLAGVLGVVLVAGALWFLVFSSDDGESPEPPPEAWAPEITELVAFVEQQRNTQFAHPVAVEPVDADEFEARLGWTDEGLTDADQAHLQRSVDVLRALGLITDRAGDDAIIQRAAPLALVGTRTVGYLPAEDRIVVVADNLDDLDLVTEIELVGALARALHSQHFGLSAASPLDLSPGATGLRAVTAGIGPLVSGRYVEELPERDQQAWADHLEPSRRGRVEDVVANFVQLPDALGVALIQVAWADTVEGRSNPTWQEINALLSGPPRSELELLQPWAAIDGFERVAVAEPVPDEGFEVLAEGNFGASSLYYALALRIDPRQALAVSLEWAGDAYVLSRDEDGRRCFDLAVEGRDGDASDRYQEALEEWAAAGPSQARAQVSRDGRTVSLTTCEPPAGAASGVSLDPDTVVSVAVNRTTMLADLRLEGMSRNRSVCIADRVLAGLPVAALQTSEVGPEAQVLFEELMDRSRVACRDL